jgi:hypothetical protein
MLNIMMGGATPRAADPAAEMRRRQTSSTRHMDKSGQGPKRAIGEAVAHLLKIQPGIHNTVESSSNRPVARVVQL